MRTAKLQKLADAGLYRATDTEIHGFFEDYRWLSNFHLSPVMYEEVVYPSSENAYQAAKFGKDETTGIVGNSSVFADLIFNKVEINCRLMMTRVSPSESKKLGGLAELDVEMWNAKKRSIMAEILDDKFYRDADLLRKLLLTGDRHLEETNWWNDTTWGVCRGVGKNWLGEVLMEVRARKRALIQSEWKDLTL